MKRLLSFIAAAAFFAAVICAGNRTVYAEEPANNNGTYEVGSFDQLMWVAENLTDGNVKLTADIVIEENAKWNGIGTAKEPFIGSFDGNGKTLTINGANGLFFRIGDAEIKGLTVVANIDNGKATETVGAVVNRVIGNLKISDSAVKGKVHGFHAGGFIGGVDKKGSLVAESCTNEAEVWGLSTLEKYGNGGIVGMIDSENECTVSDSVNMGYITSSGNRCGGIIGSIITESGTVTVKNCINKGSVRAYGNNQKITYAGGIIGSTSAETTVDSCVNSEFIRGGCDGTGAIIGGVDKNASTVKNCRNIGRIYGGRNATGCVGAVAYVADLESEGNYTISTMQTVGADEFVSDAAVDLKLKGSGALRIDNYNSGSVWARYDVSYDTEAAKESGIKFTKAVLGFYNDRFEFEELNVPKKPETKTEETRTVFSILAKDIPMEFEMKDVVIRLYAEYMGCEGFFEKGMSFAGFGKAIADNGYKNSDGEAFDYDQRTFIKDLKGKIKTVLCLGDSITAGTRCSTDGRKDRNLGFDHVMGWPEQLGELLGTAYKVINTGSGARAMCRSNNYGNFISYVERGYWKESLAACADIVFISLGTNDADYNVTQRTGDAFEKNIEPIFRSSSDEIFSGLRKANENAKFFFVIPAFQPRLDEVIGRAININQTYANGTRSNAAMVREWIEDLYEDYKADNYDITLVDLENETNIYGADGDNINHSEVYQYFDGDLLHPIDRGYEDVAKFMYGQIINNR